MTETQRNNSTYSVEYKEYTKSEADLNTHIINLSKINKS